MATIQFILHPNFLIEMVYSMIIMLSCLIIYLKTNEIYKLSQHKGIKYFRMAFLFLGITYFLRFFIKILLLSLLITGTRFYPIEFVSLTSLLVLYTGFMTTFYLFYGLSKRTLGKILPESTDTVHVLAIFLSSIVVFLNMPMIFVGISASLLVYMLLVGYSDYVSSQKKKKLTSLNIVYFLLILFSMLNIFDILIPDVFGALQRLIYIASVSLFLIILYKVLNIVNVKSNGRKKRQT